MKKRLLILLLGITYIIQFMVSIILINNALNIIFISLLNIVMIIILLTIYYKYIRINKVQEEINQALIKSTRLIIQHHDNPIEVLVKEIEKNKKELEDKETQITFMSSFARQGLILIDHNKNIIYSNQFGDSLLHLIDTKHKSYVVRIRYADIKAQIDKAFEKNEVISKEYKIDNKNLSIKTIPTQSKFQTNVLVVADDLSEKVTLQNTKKDFFNFAGHELKTPITILKGYAELIYHKIVTGDEINEVAGKMIEQSEIMTSFVEDMLMLSRLETFKDAPVIEVNLKDKIERVISQFEQKINLKNILVRTFIEDITYIADPVELEKLFKNLIENAVKYNYENGTIDISLTKENNDILFNIQNTGPGIEESDLDRVFERFYRVNQVRNQPGTGLGLSLVKHIVNKYNGTIKVESQVNKYTKFSVKL